MKIQTDFHLHTSFSSDSDIPMCEMIEQGLALGLSHMCFTEHMDYDYVLSGDDPADLFQLNVSAYQKDFQKYKELYNNRINLYFGVELGLQPHTSKWNKDFSSSYPFDFIIGSEHICNRKDPYFPSFYDKRSDADAYREYFEDLYKNLLLFDNYDVCGHMDYVVRYGKNKDLNYSYTKFQEYLEPILKHLIHTGKGLEVNSAGLRKGLSGPNPCEDVLCAYKSLGGEIITIGSDAHTKTDLAADFDTIYDLLVKCGFKYYCYFKERKPVYIKI